MKYIPLLAALCMSGLLRAQERPAPATMECLQATEQGTWMSFGLTTRQVEQVEALRTACKTDCATLKGTGEGDATVSEGILENYLADIKKIIGPEGYEKWLKWCEQRPARTQLIR